MIYNIETVRSKYHTLLDTLCREYGFGEAVEQSSCGDNVGYHWEDCDKAMDDLGIWCSAGCTRFVLGFNDDTDCIIKIQPNLDDVNYGAREAEISKAAKLRGFDKFFAECRALFDYSFGKKTITVYAMEWCDCSYDNISDASYSYHYHRFCEDNNLDPSDEDNTDRFYDESDFDSGDTEGMVIFAIHTWGGNRDDYADLFVFMHQYQINDLHAGNWGYAGSRLVMCDYGGYGRLSDRNNCDY